MNSEPMNQNIWKSRVAGLSLSLLIVLLPTIVLSQSEFIFKNQFENLDVYDSFSDSFSEEHLDEEFADILRYITPPFSTELDSIFFSEEDILHMLDIKNIFLVIYTIILIAVTTLITLLLVVKVERRDTVLFARKCIRVFGVAILMIASISILFWDTSFRIFHHILFPYNDYWLLDPSTSNLIKYFPHPSFLNIFLVLLAGWLISLTLLEVVVKRGRI